MNNEIQKFDFRGASLRTLTDKAGEPWFVAKDVCDILELGTEHLRRDLDEDEVTEATNLPNWQVGSNGGRVPSSSVSRACTNWSCVRGSRRRRSSNVG